MVLLLSEVLFKGIGYSMILYALWLFIGQSFFETYIKTGIRNIKAKKRMKRIQEQLPTQEAPKKDSKLVDYLEFLLASVSRQGEVSVSNFIMFSFIIAMVSITLLYLLTSNLLMTMIVGILVGLFPYLLILYRLEMLRVKTSLAFMNEFHIILQNYQSTNRNIYYMLLNTIEELEDKTIKRQFRKLISSFQKERHDDDFKKHVQIFVFSINSVPVKRFGNLIIKAHLDNVDIKEPMIKLNDDIVSRKKDMESEKTRKLETITMGFAPLFTLPLMFIFAYRSSSAIDFWHYFMEKNSLTLFIVCLVLSIISFLITMLIRKPRADV